jgi:hypothetical protein
MENFVYARSFRDLLVYKQALADLEQIGRLCKA